jgi:DeoR family glycerol-3-phosphate regulon repressor
MLDFDLAEVRVSRAILGRARRSFLVTDQSKLGRSAPARIASLSEIDTVFTDQALPAALMARCREWETRVVVTAS